MKARILELLKGMNSDSKNESWKCEKELKKILQSIVDKLSNIENATYLMNYFEDIDSIDIDAMYIDEGLPKYIHCNDNAFCFKTEWLDIDLKTYFEELKEKSIRIKETTIKNVENSLNKHKMELEELKKLNYETLDSKR